jgi:hypothetical protein
MKDLTNLLDLEYKGRKVPVTRNEFAEVVDPPFLVYISDDPDLTGADNVVYYQHNKFRVELYTDKKEGALEEQLEALFTDNELYFSKDGDIKIDSENLWMTVYYI